MKEYFFCLLVFLLCVLFAVVLEDSSLESKLAPLAQAQQARLRSPSSTSPHASVHPQRRRGRWPTA